MRSVQCGGGREEREVCSKEGEERSEGQTNSVSEECLTFSPLKSW